MLNEGRPLRDPPVRLPAIVFDSIVRSCVRRLTATAEPRGWYLGFQCGCCLWIDAAGALEQHLPCFEHEPC